MDFKLIYLARRSPSIRAEDWPRTWRSHAVFVSQFPTVAASVASLFYCSRVREPMLNGAPFDPPGASFDYDGVAVVSSPSEDALLRPKCPPRLAPRSIRMSFVCSAPTRRSFSFHCKELAGARRRGRTGRGHSLFWRERPGARVKPSLRI